MTTELVAEGSGQTRRCSECRCNLARDNRDTMCWSCRRRRAVSAQDACAADLRRRAAFEVGRVSGLAIEMGCGYAEAIEYAVAEGMLPSRWKEHVDALVHLADMPGWSHVEAAEALGVSRWTVANWRRQMGLVPKVTS